MDSEYRLLLQHTEVRLLSKGTVLNRMCQLKVNITSFVESKKDFGCSIHDKLSG